MDIIEQELDIPAKYMRMKDGRICAAVHRSWLTSLTTIGPVSFIKHERLSSEEIAANPSLEELGSSWLKVYIKVYPKQNRNAIPLPRARHVANSRATSELTFTQFFHYVAETNHRNLWKEAYKKYYSKWNLLDHREQYNIMANSTDIAVMQEVISRMYGCTLVQLQSGNILSVSNGSVVQPHCNLLPAFLALETDSVFMVIYEQTAKYSLQECVTYSPAALSSSHSKPLFIVYQILRLMRDMHDIGLALGDITLSDILITENFTIQVLPKLSDNIYLRPESHCTDTPTTQSPRIPKQYNDSSRELINNHTTNMIPGSPDFGSNENIERLCEMWVYGQISNFDYLTALNNLAGRRYGDPSCHHVMPWVTDFTQRNGGNWRDLTKSKFRLNKGDRQLDLTFDSQTIEVGHHVSDVLSEITYYVYLSRRYNKSVLCKHVRPLWVPWEYPASIQRLHDWSPDECIPQFFTDPNVFKSIHEDLPDLEIPAWATSPEDFIEKHREALESLYVSERLHHWIDLTFGYKLSGSAAIKSKNVCLQLVDNHTDLTSSGIVQLFGQPHPQKIVASPYWSKIPPRLHKSVLKDKTKYDRSAEKMSEDEGHSSGFEEEDSTLMSNATRSSPLALSRLLSRSRGSLLFPDENAKPEKSASQIILPKDYNPVAALIQVETMHAFLNKVSHRVYKPFEISRDNFINYKQIVASGRIKEQQILGCLIVEIFLAGKLRATRNTGNVSFVNRFNTCLNTLKASPDALPRCVRKVVTLLLQVDVLPKSYNLENLETNDTNTPINSTSTQFRYPTVTYMGLPPPSAHQLLQPILSGNLFPFSKYFQCLYNIVDMLQEYNVLARELNFILQLEEDCEAMAKTKIQYLCKISECKVKAIARELERLLPEAGNNSEASLQLIVPHVRQILEEPYSAVLAAWYLFDPIAKALGPKDAADTFLDPIVKLYENGSIMDGCIHMDVFSAASLAKFRTMRLYHRSFLLKLMVRLGLRRFLDNFITPLVEAVGGYRDHLQGSSSTNHYRTGNLKSCDLSGSCGDSDAILSPLDEDSSVDSENNIPTSSGSIVTDSRNAYSADNDVEEVFTLETEDTSGPCSTNSPYHIDMHLDLNLSLNDLSDDTNRISPPGTLKSPTIPIPRRSDGGKLVTDFNSIGCHVGSKTSSENTPFSSSYAGNVQSGSNVSENVCTLGSDNSKSVTLRLEYEDRTDNEEDDNTIRVDTNVQKSAPNDCKVSEMSTESVIWLSHRLGPVLTARYLSRNLLRMLTLCYAGRENLSPVPDCEFTSIETSSWNSTILVGDRNATKVLECLTAISGLYGEQIILLQYFAHVGELLSLCKRKLTPNLEGGLVSCLALLTHITPCLSDSTLIDVLHEIILKSILHPTVRILSTTRYTFPNGVIARSALADKYLETLFSLSLRLGNVMTKSHLTVPIQRFFLAFDKAFSLHEKATYKDDLRRSSTTVKDDEHDGNTQQWAIIGTPLCTNQVRNGVNEIADSYSPPAIESHDISDPQRNKAFEELKAVFTTEFAHKAYVMFYRYIGDVLLEEILKNHQLIRDLSYAYEQEVQVTYPNIGSSDILYLTEYAPLENESDGRGAGSFGNISVIGNRIEVQRNNTVPQAQPQTENSSAPNRESSSASRHLRGNWLAYWEHEIGRSDKDTRFNIKQIKLQNFNGHTNSIRCLHVLDNENSFMSGSRDKTVKLWSLRSQNP
ncbi:WD repeat-containing protein 81 isoform X1 [Cephus cinctus]|uniref:WD repeat-containing protein 81 isoform X1 n=1 Tax=Cephus cinctus TaxID=211228 RepID=A0AAJ7RH46_CEPCN|nr:WD repeat-containing protein 81 isoform X1 [Cephus cinctus]